MPKQLRGRKPLTIKFSFFVLKCNILVHSYDYTNFQSLIFNSKLSNCKTLYE